MGLSIHKGERGPSVCGWFLDIVYDQDIEWTRLGFEPEAELFLEGLRKCWTCGVGPEVCTWGRGFVGLWRELDSEIKLSGEARPIQNGAVQAARTFRH